MQDLTLLGHVAFLRHYAVQLHALASASPAVGARLRQIAYCLDADANQLEEVVTGEGSSEEQEQAFYGVSAPPGDDRRGCNASKSDGPLRIASMRSGRGSTRPCTGRARSRIEAQNLGWRGSRVGCKSAGSPTIAKLSAAGSNNVFATARASSKVTPPISAARRSR
jgi:hypothetical protein